MTDTDLGVEGLLGTADDDDSAGLRDRLALATRYLANWYRATASSDNKAVWWQKIDSVRAKVESVYSELLRGLDQVLPSAQVKAHYNDASASWAQLWRELMTSTDTIDVSLLSQAADFATTLVTAPALLIPQISRQLGKLVGGTIGNFLEETWPYLAGAGALALVYVFRAPLSRLASKAVG